MLNRFTGHFRSWKDPDIINKTEGGDPIFEFIKNKKPSITDRWPLNDAGEKEEPVFLCHLQCNDLSDELLVNMLEAYGIPCIIKYPGDGEFGRVIMGMSGAGTDLYVPKSMYEDAYDLYNREESEDDSVL